MTEKTTVQVEFGDDGAPDKVIAQTSPEDQVDDYFAALQSLRVVYQTTHFLLPQIRDLVKSDRTINVRPEYQRRLRWSIAQKSALIESMLLNIPIPPIYLYENAAARYEVMDGQQRLNAILDFLDDKLTLTGMTVLAQLNGLKYSLCSPRLRRELDRANVSAIILLLESEISYSESPDGESHDLRRLVFDRLNTGGRALFPQEIRNALNSGPLNDALIQMTRLPVFTTVFDIPPYESTDSEDEYESEDRQKNTLYRNMRDCELALRFVALRSPEKIRGSMKRMLDRTMKTNMCKEEAQDLVRDFADRLQFLYDLFEERPFQIDFREDAKNRVYAGMYDAAMVAIDHHWPRRFEILNSGSEVRDRLKTAVSSDGDYELLTGRRNTADAVRERIDLFKHILLPEGAC